MRGAASSIVVLFAIMTIVVTALLASVDGWADALSGLAIGQVVLVSAAAIFLRRVLWLRLTTLGVVLIVFTCLLSGSTVILLSLLSATLVTVTWCAALKFLGWHLTDPAAQRGRPHEEQRQDSPSGQFSLATIILATTILAVYCGLLRSSGIDWRDSTAMLTLFSGPVLALPGCMMLTITSRRELAWLPFVIFTGLLALFLGVVQGRGLPTEVAEAAFAALTAEVLYVGLALIALRTIGVRLDLPNSREPRSSSNLRRRRTATPTVHRVGFER